MDTDAANPDPIPLRPYGLAAGEFVVPDDFDDPLPDDILDTLAAPIEPPTPSGE